MTEVDLLEVLFPHFTGIHLERVAGRGTLVRVTASSTRASVLCPSCGSRLRADWNAVAAAVTLKWNSGSTDGQVNRIKILKRQMFGRAKPDLLRKRVLART
jgi:transposase